MPTVQESILQNARAGERELSVRRLFIVFSAHAHRNYQYSATKIAGNEGHTLLSRPDNEIVTVDCASLADALVELLNIAIGDGTAKRAKVSHGGGFATAARSRCFDVAVQGNIRMPGQTWGETGRCVFSEHYFVETGADTRWYLDPCMFTSYSTTAEVMSWKLYSGGGPFSSCVKRVDGDPSQVLLRVPPADTAPKPTGFESGLVNFKASDFKSDALLALRGHRENPQWSESKFKTHRDAAMATINKLLRERAGVNADWSVPPNS